MSLGIHIITGEQLLALLYAVAEGGDPDWVYAEMYVNAIHVSDDETEEE